LASVHIQEKLWCLVYRIIQELIHLCIKR